MKIAWTKDILKFEAFVEAVEKNKWCYDLENAI